MLRPQLPRACLSYQLCHRSQHEVFSGRASAVFWLILSLLDQDWPVAFVCSISQVRILADYPPVQSHTTASCWKHRGVHSCAWNAQQFVEGWERSASKKHKMWLWSGLFYWVFFSPTWKSSKVFLPPVKAVWSPCKAHSCLCDGFPLLLPCPLLSGHWQCFKHRVFFDFYLAISLGSKCIWFLFHLPFSCLLLPYSFENLKFKSKWNPEHQKIRHTCFIFPPQILAY